MKIIIIDGYNLIHAIPELYDIFLRDMHKAREHLIFKLTSAFMTHSFQCIVVFDSKEASTHFERKNEPIRVIYSYPEGSADDVMVKLVKESQRPRSIAIVSDDKAVRANCKEAGAHVQSPKEFWYTYIIAHSKNRAHPISEKPEVRSEEDMRFWEEYFTKNETTKKRN